MKPEIFYEKGHNGDGNPIIKRTQRLKKPVVNNTGRLKGYFQEERVNYISGNKYSNGIAKISEDQPQNQPQIQQQRIPTKTILQMINSRLHNPQQKQSAQQKQMVPQKQAQYPTSTLNQLIKKLYLDKQKKFKKPVAKKKPATKKKKPVATKKKKPVATKKKKPVATKKKKPVATKKKKPASKKKKPVAKKKPLPKKSNRKTKNA